MPIPRFNALYPVLGGYRCKLITKGFDAAFLDTITMRLSLEGRDISILLEEKEFKQALWMLTQLTQPTTTTRCRFVSEVVGVPISRGLDISYTIDDNGVLVIDADDAYTNIIPLIPNSPYARDADGGLVMFDRLTFTQPRRIERGLRLTRPDDVTFTSDTTHTGFKRLTEVSMGIEYDLRDVVPPETGALVRDYWQLPTVYYTAYVDGKPMMVADYTPISEADAKEQLSKVWKTK